VKEKKESGRAVRTELKRLSKEEAAPDISQGVTFKIVEKKKQKQEWNKKSSYAKKKKRKEGGTEIRGGNSEGGGKWCSQIRGAERNPKKRKKKAPGKRGVCRSLMVGNIKLFNLGKRRLRRGLVQNTRETFPGGFDAGGGKPTEKPGCTKRRRGGTFREGRYISLLGAKDNSRRTKGKET